MHLIKLKPITAPSLFTKPLVLQLLTVAWIVLTKKMPALESVVTFCCVTLQLEIATFIDPATWIPAGVKNRVFRFCMHTPVTVMPEIFRPQAAVARMPYSVTPAKVPLVIVTLESVGFATGPRTRMPAYC